MSDEASNLKREAYAPMTWSDVSPTRRELASRYFSNRRDVLTLLGAVLLPLAGFAGIAVTVERGVPSWDADVLSSFHDYYNAALAGVLEETLKASMAVLVALAIGAVVLLFARKRGRDALFWVVAVGGAVMLELPLKEMFQRPPLGDRGGGYSFPSGNAMASLAVLVAITLTAPAHWRRRALAVGVPLIIAYGAALVYQVWHYPSDVIAGWCFALAWTTATWLALRRPRKQRSATTALT